MVADSRLPVNFPPARDWTNLRIRRLTVYLCTRQLHPIPSPTELRCNESYFRAKEISVYENVQCPTEMCQQISQMCQQIRLAGKSVIRWHLGIWIIFKIEIGGYDETKVFSKK